MRPLRGGSPPRHGPKRRPPYVCCLPYPTSRELKLYWEKKLSSISTFSHFNAMSQINRPGFFFEEPDVLNLVEPRGVGLGEPK